MTPLVRFVLLLVMFGVAWSKDDTKYSENVNRADVKSGVKAASQPKFRHKQVNMIWEKALRKKLGENKLEDLKKQLKRIDEKFLQIKKDRKNVDMPPEQFIEAETVLNGQLEEVMMKFDMMPTKNFGEPRGDDTFRDKRIHQLWSSALDNEAFTKEELDILRRDLLEHQRKVEEFQETMRDHHKPNPSENEITPDERKPNPVEKRQADIDLKLKHREINQEFQRLSVKVIPEEEREGFSDHKVIQLWQEAKISNFSPEELEVIREELKDFEKEIQKSDQLHKDVLQAERDHHKTRNNKSDLKDHEKLKEKRGYLNSAKEELQTVSRKVTDFMRGFKDRLGKVGKKQEL